MPLGRCLLGSPTWTRTRDLRINSPSLYRLSYRGSGAEERESISIRPGAFHAFRRRNSQNACDGRADVVDVLRVEGCDANPTGGDRVDAELVAQPIHLRSRNARIGKHPPLAQDEGKVAVCPASLQSVDQALPH